MAHAPTLECAFRLWEQVSQPGMIHRLPYLFVIYSSILTFARVRWYLSCQQWLPLPCLLPGAFALLMRSAMFEFFPTWPDAPKLIHLTKYPDSFVVAGTSILVNLLYSCQSFDSFSIATGRVSLQVGQTQRALNAIPKMSASIFSINSEAYMMFLWRLPYLYLEVRCKANCFPRAERISFNFLSHSSQYSSIDMTMWCLLISCRNWLRRLMQTFSG